MKTLKKNPKTIGHRDIQVFNIRAKFRKKITFSAVCAKNTKPVLWRMYFKSHFGHGLFSFFHRPHKVSLPSEILHRCWKLAYVCAQMFWDFCEVFSYFFNFENYNTSIHTRVPKWISGSLHALFPTHKELGKFYTCHPFLFQSFSYSFGFSIMWIK